MGLGGNRPKVSKRPADIIEYKKEFKAALEEEALTLSGRKPFTDKKSRKDPLVDNLTLENPKLIAIFPYLLSYSSYRKVRMMISHILYPSWLCKETAALTC